MDTRKNQFINISVILGIILFVVFLIVNPFSTKTDESEENDNKERGSTIESTVKSSKKTKDYIVKIETLEDESALVFQAVISKEYDWDNRLFYELGEFAKETIEIMQEKAKDTDDIEILYWGITEEGSMAFTLKSNGKIGLFIDGQSFEYYVDW